METCAKVIYFLNYTLAIKTIVKGELRKLHLSISSFLAAKLVIYKNRTNKNTFVNKDVNYVLAELIQLRNTGPKQYS